MSVKQCDDGFMLVENALWYVELLNTAWTLRWIVLLLPHAKERHFITTARLKRRCTRCSDNAGERAASCEADSSTTSVAHNWHGSQTWFLWCEEESRQLECWPLLTGWHLALFPAHSGWRPGNSRPWLPLCLACVHWMWSNAPIIMRVLGRQRPTVTQHMAWCHVLPSSCFVKFHRFIGLVVTNLRLQVNSMTRGMHNENHLKL